MTSVAGAASAPAPLPADLVLCDTQKEPPKALDLGKMPGRAGREERLQGAGRVGDGSFEINLHQIQVTAAAMKLSKSLILLHFKLG